MRMQQVTLSGSAIHGTTSMAIMKELVGRTRTEPNHFLVRNERRFILVSLATWQLPSSGNIITIIIIKVAIYKQNSDNKRQNTSYATIIHYIAVQLHRFQRLEHKAVEKTLTRLSYRATDKMRYVTAQISSQLPSAENALESYPRRCRLT